MLKKITLLVVLSFSLPSFAYSSGNTEADSIPYLKAVYKPIPFDENIPTGLQASSYGTHFLLI